MGQGKEKKIIYCSEKAKTGKKERNQITMVQGERARGRKKENGESPSQ